MNRPVIIKLFSALLNLVTFLLVSVIISFLHNWYQSGDTYSFLIWTIPLAIGLAMCGGNILCFLRTSKGVLRLALIFFIACIFSLMWFYAFMGLWGTAPDPFSIPLFYLWSISSFVQLLFLERRLLPVKTKAWNIVLGLLVFPLIGLVLVYVIIIVANKLQ
jgi:hypothetical protein